MKFVSLCGRSVCYFSSNNILIYSNLQSVNTISSVKNSNSAKNKYLSHIVPRFAEEYYCASDKYESIRFKRWVSVCEYHLYYLVYIT